jgi:hypothetical protein
LLHSCAIVVGVEYVCYDPIACRTPSPAQFFPRCEAAKLAALVADFERLVEEKRREREDSGR